MLLLFRLSDVIVVRRRWVGEVNRLVNLVCVTMVGALRNLRRWEWLHLWALLAQMNSVAGLRDRIADHLATPGHDRLSALLEGADVWCYHLHATLNARMAPDLMNSLVEVRSDVIEDWLRFI